MTDRLDPVRRVVTGHDGGRRAVITEDGPPPTAVALDAVPGTVFHEIWATSSSGTESGENRRASRRERGRCASAMAW